MPYPFRIRNSNFCLRMENGIAWHVPKWKYIFMLLINKNFMYRIIKMINETGKKFASFLLLRTIKWISEKYVHCDINDDEKWYGQIHKDKFYCVLHSFLIIKVLNDITIIMTLFACISLHAININFISWQWKTK